MSVETFNVLFWLIRAAAWAFLAWSAFRHRLTRRYPLFFSYALAAVMLEVLMPICAKVLGFQSSAYLYLYVALKLAKHGVESVILLKIYWVFSRPVRWDWHLALIPVLLIFSIFANSPQMALYFRLMDAGTIVVCYCGVAALFRMVHHRQIILGWNLKMVLLAFTVASAFQSLMLMSYTVGMPVSYDLLSVWSKGANMAFWIILAIGMSEHSPPRVAASTKEARRRSRSAVREVRGETNDSRTRLEGGLALCGKG